MLELELNEVLIVLFSVLVSNNEMDPPQNLTN